jgi:hypothetical protein
MYSKARLFVPVLLLSFFTLALNKPLGPTPPSSPTSQAALHDAMRKLWEDHITWTRLFVVSALADLPDKQATTERLLANQVDIGNAIKPYYGDAAGEKLTALLKTHITTAAEVVSAAKAKDNARLRTRKSVGTQTRTRLPRF